jgi:hypothetical protein
VRLAARFVAAASEISVESMRAKLRLQRLACASCNAPGPFADCHDTLAPVFSDQAGKPRSIDAGRSRCIEVELHDAPSIELLSSASISA